ncbi:hypothetical protein C9374_000714 [Naegleria lovaniensis]|uniref:Uncharacterized protein n=1 Tax=Naegleria lovaniensis TaxID=51637 RepID=A0AA88GTF6_NAELO|nr:uncharacterized protein C9374_000714 [Naegleria lovaniensis]KAG2388550.1 hypothetical protein C9374_000714 [Naegleria lovaniensis]
MKRSSLGIDPVKKIMISLWRGQQQYRKEAVMRRFYCSNISTTTRVIPECKMDSYNTLRDQCSSSIFKYPNSSSMMMMTKHTHEQQLRRNYSITTRFTRLESKSLQQEEQQQLKQTHRDESSSNQQEEENSSSSDDGSSLILYNSKYPHFIHRFLIQPYQRNKTHIYNSLITSGLFYTIYEYDIDVNWFLTLLWLMGSSYLSYSSHVHNINHIPLVLTKLEYDSKNKVLFLYDDRGQLIDKITDFRNLILDNAMEFKVHMPLAGFFWKSFLLNRMDMTQRYALKFLHFNPNQAKKRAVAGDFGIQHNISERMKQDKITSIDPETGVMRQYVYMVVNSNPQVIQELREDLVELRQEHVKSSKWTKW